MQYRTYEDDTACIWASCSLKMIMRMTCELSCFAQSIKKLWAFVVKSLFSVLYVLASLFTNSLFSLANLTVSYGGCMNSCNDIWLSAVNNIRFSFLDVDIPFFYSLLFSVIVIFGESFKPLSYSKLISTSTYGIILLIRLFCVWRITFVLLSPSISSACSGQTTAIPLCCD